MSQFFILSVLIIVITFFMVILVIDEKKKKAKKLNVKTFLDHISELTKSRFVISADKKRGLGLDEEGKRICLICEKTIFNFSEQMSIQKQLKEKYKKGEISKGELSQQIAEIYTSQKSKLAPEYEFKFIPYKSLLSVEIFEDGDSISKTTRMSQVGSALVGNVLFGPAGALIGALTSKKKTTGTSTQIDLRILVNDTVTPLHDVAFLNVSTNKSSASYKKAIELARHWHGVLEVVIKQTDLEDKPLPVAPQVQVPTPGLPEISVADELTKLAALHRSNMLSDSEYQSLKAKYL